MVCDIIRAVSKYSILHHLILLLIVRDFIGGCVGGGIASVICYPLDVLRTRLSGQGEPKVMKEEKVMEMSLFLLFSCIRT